MTIVKKVKPFYRDERGAMSYLFDGKLHILGALLITSKKSSVRANHYHKKDSHYAFMLKGKMRYYYRDPKTPTAKTKSVLVKEGEIVYTPPMMIHAMEFLEDSTFLALTTEKRAKKTYEKDTIKYTLV